jgi:hypothetical protein
MLHMEVTTTNTKNSLLKKNFFSTFISYLCEMMDVP